MGKVKKGMLAVGLALIVATLLYIVFFFIPESLTPGGNFGAQYMAIILGLSGGAVSVYYGVTGG